jgi:hypothetical protein
VVDGLDVISRVVEVGLAEGEVVDSFSCGSDLGAEFLVAGDESGDAVRDESSVLFCFCVSFRPACASARCPLVVS